MRTDPLHARLLHRLGSPTLPGFLLRLFLLWLLPGLVLSLDAIEQIIHPPLQRAYGLITSHALAALGVSHTLDDITLNFALDGFSFIVEPVCTGLELLAFYLGAVLAWRASMRSRLAALGAGVVLLFGMNVIRIISLYHARLHWPQWFDDFHVLFWQSASAAVMGATWYVWASTRSTRAPAPA